jgi:hypothetical protein
MAAPWIERENRAKEALQAYPGGDPEDISATIVDLVTDLLHLARGLDIEPDYILSTASMHFDAEIEAAALNPMGED